jgi:hypothetical protein
MARGTLFFCISRQRVGGLAALAKVLAAYVHQHHGAAGAMRGLGVHAAPGSVCCPFPCVVRGVHGCTCVVLAVWLTLLLLYMLFV